LNRFHQFAGNLLHCSWTNQHLMFGGWHKPGPEADGEPPANNLIHATSALPHPARR
jgi:hypothetical protein